MSGCRDVGMSGCRDVGMSGCRDCQFLSSLSNREKMALNSSHVYHSLLRRDKAKAKLVEYLYNI
jgi:hypothetical protein